MIPNTNPAQMPSNSNNNVNYNNPHSDIKHQSELKTDEESPYRARTTFKNDSKDTSEKNIEINTPPKSSVSIQNRNNSSGRQTDKSNRGKKSDNTVEPTAKAKDMLKRSSKVGLATNKGYSKFLQFENEDTVDLMGCGKLLTKKLSALTRI
jgi:hypothetical protein